MNVARSKSRRYLTDGSAFELAFGKPLRNVRLADKFRLPADFTP